MVIKRSLIDINDVLEEMSEENERLSKELLFANKCLTKLIEFKTFVEFISFKFKQNLDSNELKRFEYLCRTVKEVLRDKPQNGNDCKPFIDKCFDCRISRSNENSLKSVNKVNDISSEVKNEMTTKRQRNAKSAKPLRFKTKAEIEDMCNEWPIPEKRRSDKSKRLKTSVHRKDNEFTNKQIDSRRSFDSKPYFGFNDNTFDSDYEVSPKKTTKDFAKVGSSSKPKKQRVDKQIRVKREGNELNDKPKKKRAYTSKHPYVCQIDNCLQAFTNRIHHKTHEEVVHSIYEFACDHPNCSYKTNRREIFKIHLIKHSDYQPFVCDVDGCGVRFKRNHSLSEHKKYVHSANGTLQVCDWPGCDFKTVYPKNLRDHTKYTHTLEEFVCDYPECGKRFKSQKYFRRHVKIHSPKASEQIRCDWPGCTYQGNNMPRHRLSHLDYSERKHVCDWPECGKRFTTASNLTDHKRKHSNERPFACNFPGCQFRSALSCNLTKHMTKHNK